MPTYSLHYATCIPLQRTRLRKVSTHDMDISGRGWHTWRARHLAMRRRPALDSWLKLTACSSSCSRRTSCAFASASSLSRANSLATAGSVSSCRACQPQPAQNSSQAGVRGCREGTACLAGTVWHAAISMSDAPWCTNGIQSDSVHWHMEFGASITAMVLHWDVYLC